MIDSIGAIKGAYDVVVIGAGWAGLVAARDTSQPTDLRVLVVEVRTLLASESAYPWDTATTATT